MPLPLDPAADFEDDRYSFRVRRAMELERRRGEVAQAERRQDWGLRLVKISAKAFLILLALNVAAWALFLLLAVTGL